MKTKRVSLIYIATMLLFAANTVTTSSFAATHSNNYKANISKTSSSIDTMIQQKKYDEAQNVLANMINKNPNNANARAMLGSVLAAQYKLDSAQKEFTKAIALDHNNAMAHNGLGTILYQKTTSSNMDIRNNVDKYYAAALKEFQSAIKADPSCYKAYNNAGKIFEKTGRLNEATNSYKKALDLEPKFSDALTNLGNIYFQKGQTDAALQKFQEAIESDSKNSTAYYNLGKTLIAKGQYSKAINYLQTSLYLFPNSAPVHDMLGKAYAMQGNEAAAITSFHKASLIEPEYVAPYLKLADIYQNRGDSEIAISELKTAVSANPQFNEAKLKIADISLDTGKYDQSIKYYKDVMNSPAYNSAALKGLSNAYFMKAQQVNSLASVTSESEYIDAENNIKEALQYNPTDLQLYLALLKISRLTNNDEQAGLYLNKIEAARSNKAVDSTIKAQAFQSFNKYNFAKDEYRKALSQTRNVEETLNLAEILILNRQYQVAKEAFNKVLTTSPNNAKAVRGLQRIQKNQEQAVIKFNIAKSFLKQRQYNVAIESLKDCLALNPYLEEAQLTLAKTYEKQGYFFNALEHYNAYLSITENQEAIEKYKNKADKLSQHVQKLQTKGKTIKKYTIL